MSPADFEAALRRDGITDIEHRVGAPNFATQPHTHPFEVRALVLSGEFTLTRDGVAKTHRAGDTFVMESGCVHTEQFGPEGSKYVIGRRHPAPAG
jgi:quercetin dioxygenase-like cupin family protein